MAPEVFSGVSIGGGNAATLLMQQFAVLCLAVVALVCAHEFLYHLHSILMPFVLSGFLVFAVEPAVDLVYGFLAGLSPPHRWCGCCFPRRCWPLPRGKPSAGRDGASSSQSEGGPEPDSDAAAAEPLLGAGAAEQPRGPLEGLCRFAAVGLVLFVVVMVGCASVSLLVRGAMHLKESWGAYQVGLDNWVKWLDMATMRVSGKLNLHHAKGVEAQFKELYNYVLLRLQDAVSTLVNEIVANVSAGISTVVMVFLYVLFWLWRPLPISGNASALVRNYLVKKTFVSSVYGSGVTLLFFVVGNDLAIFFGMVSFFLNYVPEVGAIISMLVPAPVILLDGRLHSPVVALGALTFGQVLLKLAINNVLEVKLIEHDREMSIHPVWVLLNLNYFGYVWGPIGMLVSVPLLAMLKSAALSLACDTDDALAGWAEAALSILEGRPGTCVSTSTAAMDKRRGTASSQAVPPASESGRWQEGGLDASPGKGARDIGPLSAPSELV
mmetsp:Transcript_43238/g.116254  ORF Transcript_43238/g.116254 Transcript_43238/m.116254 type:complete len:495 (-) Transcript_43238:7-1491(-)